ncbi:hypothetical protein L1987_19574 [Smallanthus sonchifolius]|uniref:Uncharacterized protein n=1 Tax=Smallanthus sonchifolius TaxID=185202 RepID=A0ACB9IPP7_9ASTR|nr:hypothetical protein L1987_19574 [Smallanthus sonchifolius]
MADHKRKKKRGRSKLFRSCFRSFTADERPFSKDKSDRRDSKSGRLGKPVLMAITGCEGEDSIPDVNLVNDSVTGGYRSAERSSNGRGISRLLKAVLFDSVMVSYSFVSANRFVFSVEIVAISDEVVSISIEIVESSSSRSSELIERFIISESFLSIEKSGKPSEDSNASRREPSTDVEDSSGRCYNLLSSSSRTTSSSYSSSSSSSTNSNSRWLSEPKTSSPSHLADSTHPISSISSSSSRSCFDQKSSSQTDSIHPNRQNTSISSLAKSNSLPRSSSYHKQLSQSDSVDPSSSVSPNSDKIKSGCNNWNMNIRWCLFLLLSLIVLVIYGRIYSILCTSTWLYLVPCRLVKRVNSVTNTARLMDTESEQYKKRVIMAGLLDRTRNPLR